MATLVKFPFRQENPSQAIQFKNAFIFTTSNVADSTAVGKVPGDTHNDE